MFDFLSRYVMFNVLLSIFACAAASLLFAWLVSAHVSRRMSFLDVRIGVSISIITFLFDLFIIRSV